MGVLNSFLPGGWGIRPSKELPGGFARAGDVYICKSRRTVTTSFPQWHLAPLRSLVLKRQTTFYDDHTEYSH